MKPKGLVLFHLLIVLIFTSGCSTKPTYKWVWTNAEQPARNYNDDYIMCSDSEEVRELKSAFERSKETLRVERMFILSTDRRTGKTTLDTSKEINSCLKRHGWKREKKLVQ